MVLTLFWSYNVFAWLTLIYLKSTEQTNNNSSQIGGSN